MKTKFFVLATIAFVGFTLVDKAAFAASFPIPNVDVFAKSLSSSQVFAGKSDSNGNFNVTVREDNGQLYNLFIGDQSMPPIKLTAKNGVVSGRVVILTDGTTTKDPETVVPAEVPVKKPVSKPAPAKVVKPVTKKAK